MDLDTKGCNVLLFKFSGQMTLDEGGLSKGISYLIRKKHEMTKPSAREHTILLSIAQIWATDRASAGRKLSRGS